MKRSRLFGVVQIAGIAFVLVAIAIALGLQNQYSQQLEQLYQTRPNVASLNRIKEIAEASGKQEMQKREATGSEWRNQSEQLIFSTGEFPPYVYTENGEPKGIAYEIVVETLKDMGITPVIVFEPWQRGVFELKSGRRMASFPYLRTPERERRYVFSEILTPVALDDNYFMGYNRSSELLASIKDWKDLEGYKIGGVAGNYYEELFKSRGVMYDVSSTELECLTKMIDGKVDFAVFNPLVVKHLLKQALPQFAEQFGATAFRLNPTVMGNYLMLSNDNPWAEDFLKEFNKALVQLESSGELQRIIDRYVK